MAITLEKTTPTDRPNRAGATPLRTTRGGPAGQRASGDTRTSDPGSGRPVASPQKASPEKASPQKAKRSPIKKISLLVKVIMRRKGIAHLMLAAKRFTERLGNQFAAAITYFSFLSLVPILMVGFSIAGFVLASQPDLLVELRDKIATQIPGGSTGLGATIGTVLDTAVKARTTIGIVGLVTALYSGIGWMGNVRAAVQAQWRADFDDDQEMVQESLVKNLIKNLWMLVGLGLAIVLSFALSAAGVALSDQILQWLGLSDVAILKPVFSIVPIVLAIAADVLIFAWVYSVLPPSGQKATRKALIRGSIMAAVAFEVLKFALTFFLPKVTSSATGAVFGPIIGLLFFFNLVATVVLFVAAWIATSPGGTGDPDRTQDRDEDQPEVLEPAVVVHDVVSRPKLVGLLSVGALLGWGAARRRR